MCGVERRSGRDGGTCSVSFLCECKGGGSGQAGMCELEGRSGRGGGTCFVFVFFLSACEYYNKRRGVLAVQSRPRGASCTRDPGSSEGRDRQSLWSKPLLLLPAEAALQIQQHLSIYIILYI